MRRAEDIYPSWTGTIKLAEQMKYFPLTESKGPGEESDPDGRQQNQIDP